MLLIGLRFSVNGLFRVCWEGTTYILNDVYLVLLVGQTHSALHKIGVSVGCNANVQTASSLQHHGSAMCI